MEGLKCVECGSEISENDAFIYNDEVYCESCKEELFYECIECGEIHKLDDMRDTANGLVCINCLDCDYVRCEDCGEWIRSEDSYEITNPHGSDYYICESCRYNSEYYECVDCGELFYCDDMHGDYCRECYQEHHEHVIEYHEFNDWRSHFVDNANESTLKGFELEVEGGYDKDGAASELNDIFNGFCVYEEDGSLDCDGFEIISHPFTMPWLYQHEDMIKQALHSVYMNDYEDSDDTGLHIHVNRDQLKNGSTLTIDEVIDNLLIMMEVFQDEITRFSRRTDEQINEWCKFLTDGGDDTKKDDIDYLKGRGRYQALNLQKGATIEFRIFRSTVVFEELMASIELVDNMVELAKQSIDGLTWADLIKNGKYITQYSYASDTKINLVEVL